MKDDTLILLAAVGIGGYFLYKKTTDAVDAIAGAPAAFAGGVYDAGAGAVKQVEDTISNTTKAVSDTITGGIKAIADTIIMPSNLSPPMPQYIQDAVAVNAANKGLVTQIQPKVAVIDSKGEQWKNNLAINLQTQKFGYVTANFDQPLQISTILQRAPVTYTGGGIAPKVVDIQKTYEVAGAPYATLAQQTGQNSKAILDSFAASGQKLTAVSVAPTKSTAATKSSAPVKATTSPAASSSDAHYEANLGVWVDNKTAKIVGKKAVGVWK